MADRPLLTIQRCFADLDDPRREHLQQHRLLDIVIIAIAATMCGADRWVELEEWGHARLAWLQTILALIQQHTHGEIIAIDGKTLGGAHDAARGKAALHLVRAWGSRNGLVLGQRATDAKSNEITAIPQVLQLLNIQGATVTIDAMGCQQAIAQQIVQQGGAYVLALKDNHPTFHQDV